MVENPQSQAWTEKDCPLCNENSPAYKYPLEYTPDLFVVCNANPITAGHLLIIPKRHIPCIGAFADDLFEKFLQKQNRVSQFIQEIYNSNVSLFEHGIVGQNVPHAHMHALPFNGNASEIIPEEGVLSEIQNIEELKKLYQDNGGYLFLSINNRLFSVNTHLAFPRILRIRFTCFLKTRESGSVKTMQADIDIVKSIETENRATQTKWKLFYT